MKQLNEFLDILEKAQTCVCIMHSLKPLTEGYTNTDLIGNLDNKKSTS